LTHPVKFSDMAKALIRYIKCELNITALEAIGDALPKYPFEKLFVRFYNKKTAKEVARDE